MRFLKLLGKHLPPYKGHLLLYILFTILTAVFSVFSFSAVIPLLQILFGMSDSSFALQSVSAGLSFSDTMEVFENNILYGIQEQIAAHGAGRGLLLVGLFIIGTSLLANVCSYFADFFRIPIRTGVLRDIRKGMYGKILTVSTGFLSGDNRGDAVSRMTSDALEYEWCIANTLNMLVKDPIKIIIYLITLFTISWKLALLALALLCACAVVVALIGYPIKRIAHRGQSERGQILSGFDETLANVPVIKAYTSEKSFFNRFSAINERNRSTFNRLNRVIALVTSVTDFLVMASIAVLLWVGGGQILADTSAVGPSEFIYFLLVFYSIVKPTTDMANSAYGIRKCMASVERVDKIMNLATSSDDIRCPEDLPEDSGDGSAVEFRNVAFGYADGKPLFENISFSVRKGETFALVGHTGAGKTTAASLLLRFFDPSEGEILMNGRDIRNVKAEDLRSRIGYVSQDTVLFNDTVFNNISLGNESTTIEQVMDAARKAGIHDFIMTLPEQYDTVVGDRGVRLSGGQKQCLSIARAMLKNAPVLLLDEATSALDTESERFVQDALETLKEGRTTIIISHRPSAIRSADRVCVIDGGKIVESGTPAELAVQAGPFARMFNTN